MRLDVTVKPGAPRHRLRRPPYHLGARPKPCCPRRCRPFRPHQCYRRRLRRPSRHVVLSICRRRRRRRITAIAAVGSVYSAAANDSTPAKVVSAVAPDLRRRRRRRRHPHLLTRPDPPPPPPPPTRRRRRRRRHGWPAAATIPGCRGRHSRPHRPFPPAAAAGAATLAGILVHRLRLGRRRTGDVATVPQAPRPRPSHHHRRRYRSTRQQRCCRCRRRRQPPLGPPPTAGATVKLRDACRSLLATAAATAAATAIPAADNNRKPVRRVPFPIVGMRASRREFAPVRQAEQLVQHAAQAFGRRRLIVRRIGLQVLGFGRERHAGRDVDIRQPPTRSAPRWSREAASASRRPA